MLTSSYLGMRVWSGTMSTALLNTPSAKTPHAFPVTKLGTPHVQLPELLQLPEQNTSTAFFRSPNHTVFKATKRPSNAPKMSVITKLPCEIVNAALLHVGSLQNLSSALLSCRHVHTSFQENPHLAVDILRKQIAPELLPYAVAVMEASHLAPRTAPTIHALLDRLNRSVRKEPRKSVEPATNLLDKVPFARLAQMSQTHDIVHGFVTAFSTRAWERLSQSASPGVKPEEDREPTRKNSPLSLSLGEHFRFCRAFYRLELYTRLFLQPVDDSPEDGDRGEAADGASFLRAFPAWENEAIGCVQEFVELEFAKGE